MPGLTYHGDKSLPEMVAEGGRREQSLTIPALPENPAAVQAFVDEMLSGLPCDPSAAIRTMRFERHNRISQGHKITVKYAFSLTV